MIYGNDSERSRPGNSDSPICAGLAEPNDVAVVHGDQDKDASGIRGRRVLHAAECRIHYLAHLEARHEYAVAN